MQFEQDPALEAFRAEVRAVIASDLPPELKERQRHYGGLLSEPQDSLAWTAILARRGWSMPHWPVEYGGQPWSPLQLFVFNDEMYAAYAPEPNVTASHMVGPVIYTFGSEDQKRRFLPAIVRGEYFWAQGFSEPGAGSDLAHLRTAATLRGDRWIVNGQKIWTSSAYAAEWAFCLVRTDPTVKPQRGISFLLIDLKSPGITIRRIPQINNEAELCEVFFDNVEVPAENLVGEAGQGWTYAKFLLDHERTSSSFIYWNKRELRRAREIAAAERQDGAPLAETPEFRNRLARLQAEAAALEWSVLRTLAEERFRYDPTAVASILKVAGSRLQQAITELQVDLLAARSLRLFEAEHGRRRAAPLWPDYVAGRTGQALIIRASTIFGGTLQIQRNIIAKLAFGL